MGANDAVEMLAACQKEHVRLERAVLSARGMLEGADAAGTAGIAKAMRSDALAVLVAAIEGRDWEGPKPQKEKD